MPEYTLIIELIGAGGNRQIRNSVNLTGSFIDFPSDYFNKKENRKKLLDNIESQSQRQVSNVDLDFFIKEWCHDIKQGLHITTLRRDLLSIGVSTMSTTIQSSNQNLDLTRSSNDKSSSLSKRLGTFSDKKTQFSNTDNTAQNQDAEKTQNQEQHQIETWSTSNDMDF